MGRERVLAENEDDIIARNMMVGEIRGVDGRRERRRRSATRRSRRRVARNQNRASRTRTNPTPSPRPLRSVDVYRMFRRIET